ncbi:hypothetical protein CYMTET_20839, partial [Cymbomonas tetramitiformis]
MAFVDAFGSNSEVGLYIKTSPYMGADPLWEARSFVHKLTKRAGATPESQKKYRAPPDSASVVMSTGGQLDYDLLEAWSMEMEAERVGIEDEDEEEEDEEEEEEEDEEEEKEGVDEAMDIIKWAASHVQRQREGRLQQRLDRIKGFNGVDRADVDDHEEEKDDDYEEEEDDEADEQDSKRREQSNAQQPHAQKETDKEGEDVKEEEEEEEE